MNGIFIQIFMTRILELYGYWQQFVEMASARQSSLIASGESNHTNPSRAKTARPIKSPNHVLLDCKNMQRREKSAKSLTLA